VSVTVLCGDFRVCCCPCVAHLRTPACREAGATRTGRHRPEDDDVERLGDVVKFHWEAIARDGEVFAVGLNFLVVGSDGRIVRDYTFVVG
jgi:hypothetical protein